MIVPQEHAPFRSMKIGMQPLKDITNQRFGQVLVLSKAPGTCKGHARWLCVCDCGAEFVALGTNLRRGKTKSCGHTKRTHGLSHVPEYNVWTQMIRRCYNKECPSFPAYGGRGIKVCKEWRDSFSQFYVDMCPRPFPGAELDRKDNDSHYSKDNCRWVTRLQNCQNTRQVGRYLFQGKYFTLTELLDFTDVPRRVLARRLRQGWGINRAMTQKFRQLKHA